MKVTPRMQYSILILFFAMLFALHYAFFLGLLLCIGLVVGCAVLPKKHLFAQSLGGILLTLLMYPILITPVYWFFGYYRWYSYIITVVLVIGSLILVHTGKYVPSLKIPKVSLIPYKQCILLFVSICAFMLPLLVLSQKQVSDTIYSPWTYIGPKFWVAIFIAFILALVVTKKTSYVSRYVLLSLWYAIVLLITFFVYKHAFGFDQHIHLTSMKHIVAHGFLTPKVPYYLGQYFLAIPFAEITKLSLDWVSRALVPLGAALFLPFFLLPATPKKQILHLFFLPLLPLSFFTFTTPNNLALLFALFTILWIWKERDNVTLYTHIVSIILIIFTLITHVLIGLPLALIVISVYLKKHTWLPLLGIIIGIPSLLLTFGGANIQFTLTKLQAILQEPHWLIGKTNNVFWHALYGYRALIPLIFGLICIYGYYHVRNNAFESKLAQATVSVMLLFLISVLFLSFPKLLSYEQGVYASRMLELCIVCSIPLFLVGLRRLLRYRLLLIFLFPLLFGSIYFTYPTRDAISYYTGVSIRDADIEAITFIANHASTTPYIVLTNQSIGAAAMTTFGFDHYLNTTGGTEEYFYSIPTGGPLYQYFREFIYRGYSRTSINDAMEFAGVERAYLIHTNYWAPAGEIRDVSKEVADNWWEFGNERVWVFEFLRY